MSERDEKHAAFLCDTMAANDRAATAPEFQHLWTRAQADAFSPTRAVPASSRLWTVASVFAVLLAVAIGMRDLGRNHERELATRALMAELSASLYWRAPSDQLLTSGDARFLSELPEIPMVDTSPKELNL
jgi:hypothetical protein